MRWRMFRAQPYSEKEDVRSTTFRLLPPSMLRRVF
jgi:hypothetical protein